MQREFLFRKICSEDLVKVKEWSGAKDNSTSFQYKFSKYT